jgi:7-carboxy-7-deazaguanine synthase
MFISLDKQHACITKRINFEALFKNTILQKAGNTLLKDDKNLPLMEEFYTIQGEGFHSGKPAWFIRLGGCDVGCHWCDVKESWDASLHPLTNTDTIVLNALNNPSKAVVITGGEPLTYNLDYLCSELKKNGITIYLETSGAYPLSGNFDWICLSPKKTASPLPEVFEKAHELKVIIHNINDFEWAEKNAEQTNSNCILFLQPEWSKAKEMMSLITEYVMQHPKWNISLQTHKYMNIP